ncbi:hypothetical protein, partial [Gulosibacter hominis]|uniref:hypothetical protein n=1 Tax=Gulosibacter hominis TaxID=2770504 RepID=UPI003F6BBAC5
MTRIPGAESPPRVSGLLTPNRPAQPSRPTPHPDTASRHRIPAFRHRIPASYSDRIPAPRCRARAPHVFPRRPAGQRPSLPLAPSLLAPHPGAASRPSSAASPRRIPASHPRAAP